MNLKGKKILFLSVSFFQYEKKIAQRLTDFGAEVIFFDERPSNTLIEKGIIRLNKSFIQHKINKYYHSILKNITNQHFDYFLLIKGEAVPDFFLKELINSYPHTKKIYYSFDSFSEYPHLKAHLPYFDEAFSFDPHDAKELHLHFLPLFFIPDYNTQETSQKKEFDLVFIGSAHTDRYIVGEKVRKVTEKIHLNTFFYYYAMNKWVFKLKKLFDPHLKYFDSSKISFHKLSHQQIYSYYRRSTAVLDINKPFQRGLTMRTFEALASGNKLITTNPDIQQYNFYTPQNILVINRENPQIPLSFFQTPFIPLPPELLNTLSLDNWLQTLFSA